jgi:hypothetical protein
MKYLKTFENFLYEEDKIDASYSEQHLNEDMALVGNIALGVVGGLVGMWAILTGGKVVINTLGVAAAQMLDKMEAKVKKAEAQAKRGDRLETIKPIVAKFQGDKQLEDMYQSLPPYNPGTTAKAQQSNKLRTKQLQEISNYIKSKLTPEEIDYFIDVSAMLRTGDIK